MDLIDIAIFVGFVVFVISIGLWKGKAEATSGDEGAQDYFLAGRKLTWWLVGFSLIAANISTEQFVGMSGKAADWLGMAIASYEWMAAITLVVVAFLFLPTFLKSGIYTIPEFLEYRYNAFSRFIMAVCTLVILVGVPTASVIYSGAKVITGNFRGVIIPGLEFDLGNITVGCWIIGILAAAYVFAGGLKACAWADLIQGSALILGGVVIAFFAMKLLADTDTTELVKTARDPSVTAASLEQAGPIQRFWDLNKGDLPEGKVHMVRELTDKEIPWSALLIGLWIPNFFYWGLNQYITQRTLGSRSLAQGQKGVVFAAFLKLIIPFIVVVPGILAFNLFNGELKEDAVNRNAQLLSEYTPALYNDLSDQMKPNPADERNKMILKTINENLAAAQAKPAKIQLYEFEEVFVGLHLKDAADIVAFNYKQITDKIGVDKLPSKVQTLPADDTTPLDLAIYNASLVKTADDKLKKDIDLEKLVAHDYDNAFPTLIRKLLKPGSGIKGFVLAAIFGAVVSSLASMLNSASTIATMDIYRKVHKGASQFALVSAGRFFVVLFVLIAMIIAPFLGHPRFGGIFTFIQEFQGFISPGILAIFLFGLLVHRAPRSVGTIGLIMNPILYGLLKWWWLPNVSFLDRMAICFFAIVAVLTAVTIWKPLEKPVVLPVNKEMDMTMSKGAMAFGVIVVCLTLALYVLFW